jgi:hypothetical protein
LDNAAVILGGIWGQGVGMTCFIAGITPKNKMNNDSYKTHDKVASPPTNPHDNTADNSEKDTNLSDVIAAISWHFVMMI